MDILVLVERIEGGFRARTGEPLGIMSEGATKEEADEKLQELLTAKLQNGSELVPMTLPSAINPLARMAGIYDKDDPMVQEWIEIMKENRRKADGDPNYL